MEDNGDKGADAPPSDDQDATDPSPSKDNTDDDTFVDISKDAHDY